MEHVAPEIAQLASRVKRHEQDPWLKVDSGAWVRLEHAVAIEPLTSPTQPRPLRVHLILRGTGLIGRAAIDRAKGAESLERSASARTKDGP
jgi:hypothetical protein